MIYHRIHLALHESMSPLTSKLKVMIKNLNTQNNTFLKTLWWRLYLLGYIHLFLYRQLCQLYITLSRLSSSVMHRTLTLNIMTIWNCNSIERCLHDSYIIILSYWLRHIILILFKLNHSSILLLTRVIWKTHSIGNILLLYVFYCV